jgi:hypothetical protein
VSDLLRPRRDSFTSVADPRRPSICQVKGVGKPKPQNQKEDAMQNKRILTVIIVSVSFLISVTSPAAMGQQPAIDDWNVVQSLSPDQEIVIGLKSGNEVKGRFLDAGASELTITRKGKHESFAKDTIAQIQRVKGKAKKGMFALIGAGVGAGTGFAIGQSKNGPNVDDGAIYPFVGTLLGTGIGAVSGFFIGQTRRNRELVYRAR